jgi:regulator of sigma E protease
MSWLLALGGFAALIVLHELGHFLAAKAVGMRVERFALFFPPLLVKVRRGETEYGIGAIPLGGYVKITGMNPEEKLPPEVEHRAYYRQKVWKRIVVIAAGPAMNVLLAFLILWALFLARGTAEPTKRIDREGLEAPASAVLKPGDEIVSVDGKTGEQARLSLQIATHKCPGEPREGCRAATPARVVVKRAGRRLTFDITPRYDAERRRTRIGFAFAAKREDAGVVRAARLSVSTMWEVTTRTVSAMVRIFDPEQRKELSGVVGATEVTQQSFQFSTTQAIFILAVVSLSLAIINLFPFLPLDGGHIFWAVAEKVRGRAIPFSVLERASVVGFMLVMLIFFIGLSNDIGRLRGDGFNVR